MLSLLEQVLEKNGEYRQGHRILKKIGRSTGHLKRRSEQTFTLT